MKDKTWHSYLGHLGLHGFAQNHIPDLSSVNPLTTVYTSVIIEALVSERIPPMNIQEAIVHSRKVKPQALRWRVPCEGTCEDRVGFHIVERTWYKSTSQFQCNCPLGKKGFYPCRHILSVLANELRGTGKVRVSDLAGPFSLGIRSNGFPGNDAEVEDLREQEFNIFNFRIHRNSHIWCVAYKKRQ